MPIDGGVLSLTVGGAAKAAASVGFRGKVGGGVQYRAGAFRPLFDREARPSFEAPTVNASASASVVAFLQPSVRMSVDKVLSATVVLRPSAELAFAGGGDAALRLGLDAWVSGQLGVQQAGGRGAGPHKVIDTEQLLHEKTEVWSGRL